MNLPPQAVNAFAKLAASEALASAGESPEEGSLTKVAFETFVSSPAFVHLMDKAPAPEVAG